MAEDHVESAKKARDQLVDQRRNLVAALAEGYKPGETETWIERVVKIQEAIGALDAAIRDEQRLSPEDRDSQPGAGWKTPA
jgi:hypothetical protein